MNTPRGYTNRGQIQNYLLHGVKDYFVPQIDHWIAQMEEYIEKTTGRIFIADTISSIRKYDVPPRAENFGTQSGKDLFIDDCVEVEELTVDDELIDEDEYLLYPANSLPKTRISFDDENGYFFTPGKQIAEVKAKWGYSIVCPYDIAFATMILVVGIINYALQSEGEVKSETIGSYSITYKDEKQWQDFDRAKEILDHYTRTI